MGIFDFWKQPDINRGFQEFMANPGSVLLDVRTPEEYAGGHIPGSKNVPLQSLEDIRQIAPQTDAQLYVYCRSGARSREATGLLHRMGYGNAKNIGGIIRFSGKLER